MRQHDVILEILHFLVSLSLLGVYKEGTNVPVHVQHNSFLRSIICSIMGNFNLSFSLSLFCGMPCIVLTHLTTLERCNNATWNPTAAALKLEEAHRIDMRDIKEMNTTQLGLEVIEDRTSQCVYSDEAKNSSIHHYDRATCNW